MLLYQCRLHARHSLAVLLLLFQCHGEFDEKRKIESARLYGNIDYYQYWFVDLVVGTPPQRVSTILDTGSNLAAFSCTGCDHCGQHIDAVFDFSKSSTAVWATCDGCNDFKSTYCSSGRCTYHQAYAEGSSIAGNMFADYVHLGDTIQKNPSVKARMGCHESENNLFYTQKANGILGIKGGYTFIQELFKDKKHVKSKVFSICFSEWGGRLNVGGWVDSYHTGSLQWVSMNMDNYHINLKSVTLPSGIKVTFPGQALVDTGTTYTYMASEPYKAITSAISSYCSTNGCGTKRGIKCWDSPSGKSKFPSLKVDIDGVEVLWEPRAYLIQKGNSSKYCLGFGDDGPGASTTLGASFMLYHDLVWDHENSKFGMVSADCPEHKWRPEHDPHAFDTQDGGAVSPLAIIILVLAASASCLAIVCCLCRKKASEAETTIPKPTVMGSKTAVSNEEREGFI